MKIFGCVFAAALAVASFPLSAADDGADSAVSAPVQDPAATANSSYLSRAGELAIQALALIGVNYKYGGNSAESGLDCSGLVSLVFRNVAGKVLPRNSRAMSTLGDKIEKTGLQPGDLVFFNTRRAPYSHVGIYIGDHRFVHAPSRGREVEISNMHDRYWQKRYNGARRVSI
jgi:cell wall-associated NlpC family hydrolase